MAVIVTLAQRRYPAGIAAACLLTILSILFVDRPAAAAAHATFHGMAVFVWLTHLVDPFPPLAALALLGLGVALVMGRRPGRVGWRALQGAVAVLAAIAVKDQGKYAFGRLWPETWVNNNPSWIGSGAYGFFPFHGGTGWSSFPSGHMTVITAAMTVLWFTLHGPLRWLAALPVLLVAIGLYGANYHFVADLIGGTLVGFLCARIVTAVIPPGQGAPTESRR